MKRPTAFDVMVFPLIIQGVLTASLPYFDLLLLSGVGAEEVSSVAISGAILMVLMSVQFGFAQTVIALKTSHDSENVRSFFFALSIATLVSTLMALWLWINIATIIKFFVKNLLYVDLVSSYLRWLAISLPITQITLCCGFFLRSYGKTKVTLQGFLIEVPTNIVISYFLIYSVYMGIEGAAIGSLLARLVRLVWMVFHTRVHIKGIKKTRSASISSRGYLKQILSLFGTSFYCSVAVSAASLYLYSYLSILPPETFAGYSIIMTVQGMSLTVLNAVTSIISVMAKMDTDTEPVVTVESYYEEMLSYLKMCLLFFTFISCISIYASGIVLDFTLISIFVIVSLDLVFKSFSAYFSTSYLRVFNFHKEAVKCEVVGRCITQTSLIFLLATLRVDNITLCVLSVLVAEVLTFSLLRRVFYNKKAHYLDNDQSVNSSM
ncbi:MATE family efflux transporter [Vibrio nigripulchritudo]|uniref:MATE family efflux transporter n=1 Tax=Vibrio nigripulchritudo TaxID=28173 RepID=UPI00190E55CD|nr:MATE family efflux transporter [Vibrio nigripulchritudo]